MAEMVWVLNNGRDFDDPRLTRMLEQLEIIDNAFTMRKRIVICHPHMLPTLQRAITGEGMDMFVEVMSSDLCNEREIIIAKKILPLYDASNRIHDE